MRYLCRNPDCRMFARLVAGTAQVCPACEQRVLDEKVMLKNGLSLQAIIATKGRVVQAPAPAPDPKREEGTDLTRLRQPRRTWDEIKAAIPPELLAKDLASKSKFNVARDHGMALKTLDRLIQEYGIVIPRRQGKSIAAPAEEGTAVGDMTPESLAAEPIPGPQEGLAPGTVAAALATGDTSAEDLAAAFGLSKPSPKPATPPVPTKADPPAAKEPLAPAPNPGGFRAEFSFASKTAENIAGGLAMLDSLVSHSPGVRFNLTVILEEAS